MKKRCQNTSNAGNDDTDGATSASTSAASGIIGSSDVYIYGVGVVAVSPNLKERISQGTTAIYKPN